MKRVLFTIIAFTSAFTGFSQTNEETAVKELSARIFTWEVAGASDSLTRVFHEKLQVWGSSGEAVNKTDYLKRLSSPDFIHNNVTVEKSQALVVNNTAIVNGEGIFELTISGKKTTLHLSYTEVFTRENSTKPWMLLTINAKPKTE